MLATITLAPRGRDTAILEAAAEIVAPIALPGSKLDAQSKLHTGGTIFRLECCSYVKLQVPGSEDRKGRCSIFAAINKFRADADVELRKIGQAPARKPQFWKVAADRQYAWPRLSIA